MKIINKLEDKLDDFFEKLNIKEKNKNFFSIIIGVAFFLIGLIVIFSPVKVLAIIIGLVFLIVSFFKPEWIVFFLALYIPFEPFLLKFIPDDIYVFARYFSEILIYLILIGIFWRFLNKEKYFKQTPLDISFVLFILVLLVSWVVNFVPSTIAVLGIRQIIRFILLFYAVSFLDIKKDYIRKIIFSLFIISFIQSIIGLFQALIGSPADAFLIPQERKVIGDIQLTAGTDQFWEGGSRIFATMGRYDQLGIFLSFFLLCATAFLYQIKEKKFRWFLFCLLATGLPALILTFSRASWFGFLLGFILISIVIKKDKRFSFILLGVSIIAVIYLIYSGLVVRYLIDVPSQTVIERFFEAFSYERWRGEYYGMGRLFFIVNTILLVVPRFPIFGAGPGQFGGGAAAALHNTTVYDKVGLPFGVYGTEGYIDNNWLSLLGETGILGFLLYASMFAILFFVSYKVFKKSKSKFTQGLSLGFLGIILAFTFQAFLGTYLEVRTAGMYFWLIGGMLVCLYRQEKIKL